MGKSYASPRDTDAQTASPQGAPLQGLQSNTSAQDELAMQGPGPQQPSLLSLAGGSDEEQAFLTRSWPLLEDFLPGNGGIFDAQLVGTQLTIILKVAFDFVAGDPSNAPAGTPKEDLQWTPEAQATFRDEFIQSVAGTWGGKYAIRSTKPGWKTELSTAISVVEDSDDPHFKIGVLKYPDDVFPHTGVTHDSGFHSVHRPGTSDRYDSLDNEPGDESGMAWFDSNAAKTHYPPAQRDDADPRYQGGRQSIYFEVGQSDLDSGDQATLGSVAEQLTTHPDWRAELTGRASADGDAAMNLALSRARSQSVKGELESSGVESSRVVVQNVGEEAGHGGRAWKAKAHDVEARRVDVDLVAGQDHQTAAHEAGHMFGLEDEYGEEGAPLVEGYQELITENTTVKAEDLPTRGKTDSLMSEGAEVKNWHYAPFVAAVKKITGSNDWTV
jgi:outer membrane protein OmpA-like peptidoglycan-associated protein